MQTEKLIRMAQRGDKSVLDKLIRLYYDSVFSYCYHHVGKFQNYLYVAAGNKCKNYYKKHREFPVETLPEQTQTLFEAEEGVE